MKGIRKGCREVERPQGRRKASAQNYGRKDSKEKRFRRKAKGETRVVERQQDRRKASESKRVFAPAEWRVAHTNMCIQQKTTNTRTHTCTPALADTRTRTHTHRFIRTVAANASPPLSPPPLGRPHLLVVRPAKIQPNAPRGVPVCARWRSRARMRVCMTVCAKI